MHRHAATVAALLLCAPALARADVALSIRAGAGSVGLEASSDTPVVGGTFDDAITAYNGAARAYNQAHGYRAGSTQAAPQRQVEDMSLSATLVTIAPGLDFGISYYRGRVEVPLGVGDLSTVGLGFYPLGASFAPATATAMPYVLAGGIASYVSDGTRTGALFEMRLAGGVRIGRRFSVELGVRPYTAGGTVDRERIDVLMDTYDPRGAAPPPAPGEVVRGGVGSGAIDLAIGLSL
jgi:hypothetical protein